MRKMDIQKMDMEAVVAGKRRLTGEEALALYWGAELHDLGRWADGVARRKMQEAYPGQGDVRTYVIDRNINYTNVCSANCTFCAFKRDEGEEGAYTLSREQLHEKIRELVAIGGTQVLLQGGMHPGLGMEFYEEMLRGIKGEFPGVHVHGFSPPELVEFVAVLKVEGFGVTEPGRSEELGWEAWRGKLEVIMRRLMEAGLDSIPGGGGEIFAEHVRRRIGIGKATGEQWLEVMSMAHRLGMKTSGTMMFGHIEGVADRIDHLLRLRQRQDLAIEKGWGGRYVSFIAWPFQRENTPLGRVKEWEREGEDGEGLRGGGASEGTSGGISGGVSGGGFAGDELAQLAFEGKVDGKDKGACDRAVPGAGKSLRTASAAEYLRVQAISRLVLDNFHSIGASWVTMGPKVGQMGLFFGANDMGSVMMEENVVSAAGTTYCLDEAVICRLIREAGFVPAQRGNGYELLKVHQGADSPDLKVKDWSAHRAKKLHVEGGSVSEGAMSGGSGAGNGGGISGGGGGTSGGTSGGMSGGYVRLGVEEVDGEAGEILGGGKKLKGDEA